MSDLHILIVDDSASARHALKRLISPLNAMIAEATDGLDALNLVGCNKFDLIITDFSMPRMDGLHFCRQLKNDPATMGIPVIMLSSFDSETDINNGFIAGASAYVSKMEAQTRICETVEEVLAKSAFHRNRSVLVVDDSFSIRDLVSVGLSKAGFQVMTANNGKAALQMLDGGKPPDLIISDIDMPEMNGFAFCEAIHADPALSGIPFLVMSTYTDRGYMMRMIRGGVSAYIVKPFNIDQLVILADKLLSDQFLILLKEKERLDTERNLMLASITSLVSALEARDVYTRGHSDAVSGIISGMVALDGGTRQEIETVSIGGQLHDIGKIGIRDNVLLKPDRLTKEEFAQIRRHPLIGAEILRPVPSLCDVVAIVASHHERMDGKGYPYGLKGEKIPKWARMTAVADAFDALTSDRPYRKGVAQEKALQIIEDGRGNQFCPYAVDLFMRWINSKRS
jgi:response regulator RpfG family c-di-GMP phosphodiesterase